VLKKQHFVLSGASGAGAGAGAGAGVGVGAGAAAGTVFGPVAFTPFAAGTAGAIGVVAGAFPPFATSAGAEAAGVVAGAFPLFAAGAGTGGDLEALALFDDEAPVDVAPWTVGSVVSFGKFCIRHSNIIQYDQYKYVSFSIIQYHSVFTLLVFISSEAHLLGVFDNSICFVLLLLLLLVCFFFHFFFFFFVLILTFVLLLVLLLLALIVIVIVIVIVVLVIVVIVVLVVFALLALFALLILLVLVVGLRGGIIQNHHISSSIIK